MRILRNTIYGLAVSLIIVGCFVIIPSPSFAASMSGPNDPKKGGGSGGGGGGGGEEDPSKPDKPSLGSGDDVKTDDPIRVYNGNNMLFEKDLIIPCPLLDLKLTRSYNSKIAYDGPIGQAWCHSYDWFLYEENSLIVLQAVADNFAGSYRGDLRSFNSYQTIKGNVQGYTNIINMGNSGYQLFPQNNGYRLRTPGGINYWFDSEGVLLSIKHDAGACVTLSYTNAFNDELILAKVEHSNGQYLDFSYPTNDGRVAAVYTPDTNVWVQYQYNQYGDLTNATRHTRQGDFTTQYEYKSTYGYPDHALTKRVNARGESFHFEYAYGGGRNRWCTGMYAEPWDKYKVRLVYTPAKIEPIYRTITVKASQGPASASVPGSPPAPDDRGMMDTCDWKGPPGASSYGACSSPPPDND